ncbi:MAG TPA: CARDB domain-containing protein, partial [Chitinophagaceae bacterium]|nr:CARDB domain-containing protein [Chitinophagaceae bacterium]
TNSGPVLISAKVYESKPIGTADKITIGDSLYNRYWNLKTESILNVFDLDRIEVSPTNTIPSISSQSKIALSSNNSATSFNGIPSNLIGSTLLSSSSIATNFLTDLLSSYGLFIGIGNGALNAGTYCVGPSATYSPPSGPNYMNASSPYSSIHQALNDIALKGQSGPVILELQQDYNGSLEPTPLNITYKTTADRIVTIKVRSDLTSPLLLEKNVSTGGVGVIQFNGSKYVHFDCSVNSICGNYGLIVRHTGTPYVNQNFGVGMTSISFKNDASQISIKGLQIEISDNGITFDNTLGTQGCDSNTIACNKFMTRTNLLNTNVFSNGIRLSHYGSTPTISSNAIIIDHNHFDNCALSIWLYFGSSGSFTITNNSMYRSVNNNPGPAFNGFIHVNNIPGNSYQLNVSDNYFGGTMPFCGGVKMDLRGLSNNLNIFEVGSIATAKSIFNNNHLENLSYSLNNTFNANLMSGGVWDVIGNTFGNPSTLLDITSSTSNGFNCIQLNSNSNASTSGMVNRIEQNSFNNIHFTNPAGSEFHGISHSGNVQTSIQSNVFKNISAAMNFRFFLISANVTNTIANQTNTFQYNEAENIQQLSNTLYEGGAFYLQGGSTNTKWNIAGNRIGSLTNTNDIIFNGPIISPFQVSLTAGINRFDSNSVSHMVLNSVTNSLPQVVMNLSAHYVASCAFNKVLDIQSMSKTHEAEATTFYGGSLTGMRIHHTGNAIPCNIHHNIINGLHDINIVTQINPIGVVGLCYNGLNIPSSMAKISDNEIYNLTNQGISSGANPYIKGIHFNSGNASLFSNRIAISNASYTNNINLTGIYKAVTNVPFSCYHNSISIIGTSSALSKSYAFRKGSSNGTDTIKNNIFQNIRSGAGLNYAMSNYATNTGTWGQCNFNNLFANDSTTTIESVNGINSTFSQWQTTHNKDINSKNLFVSFVDSSLDLHITTSSNCGINAAGSSGTNVLFDIDGEARHATQPDLGADEFAGSIYLEAGSEKFICKDSLQLNGQLQLGTTGFWTGSGVTFTPSNTDPNAIVHGLTNGLNTLVWHVSNAYCSRTDTLKLHVGSNSGPLSTNYVTPICPGTNVEISLSAPLANGIWSTGDTSQIIQIQPITTNTITVVGTDIYACPVNLSLPITVLAPSATIASEPLVPFNQDNGLHLPVTFNWTQGVGLLTRALFVWNQNDVRPLTGLDVTNLTQTTFSNLSNDTNYYWQLQSISVCDTLWSDTFSFKVNHPDLILEQINCNQTLYSFSPNTISWVVKNIAANSTTKNYYWSDMIGISLDTVIGNFNDIFIGEFNYLHALTGGNQYTQQKTITLPELASGNYRLYIRAGNVLGLDLNQTNNLFWKDVQILHKPSADLKVVSLGSPADAFAGDSISVIYTVENDGLIATAADLWNDAVYISELPFFNSSAIKLDEYKSPNANLDTTFYYTQNGPVIQNITNQPYAIQTDSIYSVNRKFRLPTYLLSGQYYIYVKVNSNHPYPVYEGAYLGNNLAKSPIVLSITQLPPSDLVIDSFACPSTMNSGTLVPFYWRVKNQGIAESATTSWRDRVYINTTNTIYGATLLGSVVRNQTLLKDSSYQVSGNFKIPNGLNGLYYVMVKTDDSNEVFEYLQESNNTYATASPININLSPYPDLQITNVHFDLDTLQSNIPVTLHYTIKNTATASSNGTFYQGMYYINPNIDPDSLIYFNNDIYSLPILAGDSVQRTKVFYTPNQSGVFTYFVKADIFNNQYEHDLEGNNLSLADTVQVQPFYSDLGFFASAFATSTTSGQSFPVSYVVKNFGTGSTTSSHHVNGVYISTDSLYSVNDIPLNNFDYFGLLDSSQTYSHYKQINLPSSLVSGNYYLLVKLDLNNEIMNDDNNLNNLVAIPFTNTQIPSPDLDIISMNYPSTLNQGQSFWVSYTVKNNGPGLISNLAITDIISISSGVFSNKYNIGYNQKLRNLAVNDTYTDSILVTSIPTSFIGSQIFHIKTDARDVIYENTFESNNEMSDYVFIQTTSNMDLMPISFQFPKDSFLLGEQVIIPYSYTNIGTNSFPSYTQNSVTLTNSTSLESTLLGFNQGPIIIAPGDTLHDTLRTSMQQITPFWVNAQLALNTTNSFPESNYTNNFMVNDSIYIDAEELIPEVPTLQTLSFGQKRYYKINVTPGQDLAIFVKKISGSGQNEIYCSYQKVPNSPLSEFSANDITTPDQRVLVPETQNGLYYLFLQNNLPGIDTQHIEITAKILPPSIISVDKDEVGQGQVTTSVIGSGFRTYSKIFLALGDSIVTAGTIVNYINTMQMDVQWNLDSVALGFYDVKLVNNTDTFSLSQALKVELSSGYEVSVNTQSNGYTIATRIGGFETNVTNTGNVNIPVVYFQTAGLKEKTFSTFNSLESTLGIPEDTTEFEFSPGIKVGRKFDGIAFNLRPGESRAMGVHEKFSFATCAPERGCPMIYRVHKTRTMPMSSSYLTKTVIYHAEQQRQQIMTAVHENNPSMANLMPDKKLFYEIVLSGFMEKEILDSSDIENYVNAEFNRYIDFDPGQIIGLQTEHQINFNSGDVYRWDINVPTIALGGHAGKSIGWDLVKSTGDIHVNASSFNRFEIQIIPHNPCNKDYTTLTSWEPWHDYKWPIAVAEGDILGFDANKFFINEGFIDKTNNLYGGHFEVSMLQDTIFLEFKHRVRNAGENGYNGGPGLCGFPAGNGESNVMDAKGGDGGRGWTDNTKGGDGGSGTFGGGSGGMGFPSGMNGTDLDMDNDNDGIADSVDVCPNFHNPLQTDTDGDGFGNECDPYPLIFNLDVDEDNIPDTLDNCRWDANYSQYDFDHDGIGDICDNRPNFDCIDGITCAEFVNCDNVHGCNETNITCTTCGKNSTKENEPDGLSECTEALNVLAGATNCATDALGCWQVALQRVEDQGYMFDAFSTAGAKNRDILREAWEECGLKAVFDCVLSSIPGFDCGSSLSDLVKSAKSLRKEPSLSGAGSVASDLEGTADNCEEDAEIFSQCKLFSVSSSFDPNYIFGPEGRGDTTIRWVPALRSMPYTIQFENDSLLATASAQRVVIEQNLDPNVDPLSFRIQQVAFNNMTFDLPELANYSGILDLDDSLNYDVQVTAGLDIANLKIFCILQTINPNTGLPPNSNEGLLP